MLQQSVSTAEVRPLDVRHRVLLVEDERKTRERICGELEELDCDVFTASSSYEAIRLVTEHRPDVVICDGLLPQMHGFELARYIRHFDTEYRPRIVLMTAIYKHIRYRNEARLKYGIDAYLIKPVTRKDLQEVLA